MAILRQEQVPLRAYTTLKTGGFAQYLVGVQTTEELEEALMFAASKQLPYLILGGGSNLLVGDAGFPGVVIKMEQKGIEYTDVPHEKNYLWLTAQAGESFDQVVEDSVARGLWGLENLSAIPGTVGATPIQNVGAYGVEVSDRIVSVCTYHVPTKTEKVFSNEDCNFLYRDSFFKTIAGQEYIITAVTFQLEKKSTPKISYADLANFFGDTIPSVTAVREAVIAIRSKKFPNWRVVGTAGSFFKNPIVPREVGEALHVQYPALTYYVVDQNTVKIPLGFVLDKVCGLKGFTKGPVRLYEAQALVLVHDGTATTTDIVEFAKIISEKVYEATHIVIEPEVRFINVAH